MLQHWDERAALYFSLASPSEVWGRLDVLSRKRFYRLLTVKRGLPLLSEPELQQARLQCKLDLMQQDLARDSSPALLPGQVIGLRHLDRVPPSVKLAVLLCELQPRWRHAVLKTLEANLAHLLSQRIGQKWQFSPQARRNLIKRCRFDRELFEQLAQSAPSCLADWLLGRIFFGTEALSQLCELSPILGRPIKNCQLRRRVYGSPKSIQCRRQRAAIVLMSLPPELSAQFFKLLGPDTVHAITLAIADLPPIGPQQRLEAIVEVTRLLPAELESVARSEAEKLGEQMRRYLEEG
ncbi:hypothetical protein JST97_00755 [bacterium]|nr:hypothetical protein [bacterium]